MSKPEEGKKKSLPEVKTSDKKEDPKQPLPSERDHYVYESIIAEIGY